MTLRRIRRVSEHQVHPSSAEIPLARIAANQGNDDQGNSSFCERGLDLPDRFGYIPSLWPTPLFRSVAKPASYARHREGRRADAAVRAFPAGTAAQVRAFARPRGRSNARRSPLTFGFGRL